jgi:hypothetical protein
LAQNTLLKLMGLNRELRLIDDFDVLLRR